MSYYYRAKIFRSCLPTSDQTVTNDCFSQSFAKLMFLGLLSNFCPFHLGKELRVLRLNDTVSGSGKAFDILKSKHPAAVPLHSAALLPDSAPSTPIHSVVFDMLDGSVIRANAL